MENVVKISPSVIESIVLIAINETKNVYPTTRFLDKLKGNVVRVEQDGEDVFLEVFVDVDYGLYIPDVVKAAQEEIKNSIEMMTNLNVVRVDAIVQGLKLDMKKEA